MQNKTKNVSKTKKTHNLMLFVFCVCVRLLCDCFYIVVVCLYIVVDCIGFWVVDVRFVL